MVNQFLILIIIIAMVFFVDDRDLSYTNQGGLCLTGSQYTSPHMPVTSKSEKPFTKQLSFYLSAQR